MVSDALFAGKFEPANPALDDNDGFDKLGDYGYDNGTKQYRFLLDFTLQRMAVVEYRVWVSGAARLEMDAYCAVAREGAMPASVESAKPADAAITYRIRFKPGPDSFRQGNDPLRLLRVLGDLGTLAAEADIAALPAGEDFDPERCYVAWDLDLASTATLDV